MNMQKEYGKYPGMEVSQADTHRQPTTLLTQTSERSDSGIFWLACDRLGWDI